MELITDKYRSLNEELHASNPKYGTSGAKYLSDVIDLAKSFKTQDILDYGCGKSTLAMNLPFPIKQYDPAVPKFSKVPEPAHIVVCTDVLEHIEPYCLEDVLDHLKELTLAACYLVVATRAAQKSLPDGRNAHLIQKPSRWWMEKLWDRFEVVNFAQSQGEFKTVLINKEMNNEKK
jgi:hypothetical protein